MQCLLITLIQEAYVADEDQGLVEKLFNVIALVDICLRVWENEVEQVVELLILF